MYIMRNFSQLIGKSQELLELPLAELEAMIGADELNVKSEEIVWETVLKWIDFDPENRKPHIVELMKNIRLGLLETQFFLEKVKDHPYVARNEACRPVIIETLRYLDDKGEVIILNVLREPNFSLVTKIKQNAGNK